jgi:hypothetical protein
LNTVVAPSNSVNALTIVGSLRVAHGLQQNVGRGLAEQRGQLGREMSVRRFRPDDPASDCEQNDEERRDGECAVEGERCADRRGLIAAPVRDRAFGQRP